MSSETEGYVWEHKYRPKHIKDVILPQDYKNFFNKILNANASVNVILASKTGGTGKTTCAEALANDLGCEFQKINASDDRGIQMVREKIVNFAGTVSMDDKPKLVILDEADGLVPDAQRSLKTYIDEFQDTCRFILTCNKIGKIIPQLQEAGGRTMVLEFEMNKPEYRDEMKVLVLKRLCGILKYEKIEYDEEVVKKLIDKKYPSIRSLMAVLQKYSMMKGKIDESVISYAEIGEELAKLVLGKHLTAARQYISERGLDYTDVFGFFMDNVVPQLKNPGDAIISIADYEANCALSSDPSIQIAACIVSLFACI